MKPVDELTPQITGKTDAELLAMLSSPADWLPETLDIARAELRRRNVEPPQPIQPPSQSAPPQEVRLPRSPIITVLCILGFIGNLMLIALLLDNPTRHVAPLLPHYVLLSVSMRLVCIIGLWRMRKWAVFGYTGIYAFHEIVASAIGLWEPSLLLSHAFIIILMFTQLPRMR